MYELEAVSPEQLQQYLRAAIEFVLDRDAFEHEVEREKRAATFLVGVKRFINDTLKDMKIED